LFGTSSADRQVKGEEFTNLFAKQKHMNAKTKLAFALCTVVALSMTSLRADDKDTGKSGKLSRGDEKFIKEACEGGMMELKMGKLGVQKAQNAQVKQFAQTLIDDHTKANTELKQLAASKGCTLPESQDSISSTSSGTSTSTTESADRSQVREKADSDRGEGHKEHAAMKKLQSLSGTEFDREFVKMAVNDHQKDIKEFEKASKNADDTELKSFAAKTLPTLRQHLQQAKSLQSQVSATGAAGSDSGVNTGKSQTQSDVLK
jgi:putative membrane protein